MKQYLLKMAGGVLLAFALSATASAQDDSSVSKPEKIRKHDEVIITRKGDKDVSVTIEIKDGQVFINGKKVDDFQDDNISVQKRVFREFDGSNFAMVAPDIHVSPFRSEDWSYSTGDSYSKTSKSTSAFLGVTSEDNDAGGVIVTQISKASAAEKAGLKKGDIITRLDDQSISSPEELSKVIHKYKPEDKIAVTYKRDGKEMKVSAVLGQYKYSTSAINLSFPKMDGFSGLDQAYAPHAYSFSTGRPHIGIRAQDTEEGNGVKVLDIDDESPADKAGLKEGDVITEFDGKTVKTSDELASASRTAREKASFKVKFLRNQKAQEVEIKIPKKLKTTNL